MKCIAIKLGFKSSIIVVLGSKYCLCLLFCITWILDSQGSIYNLNFCEGGTTCLNVEVGTEGGYALSCVKCKSFLNSKVPPCQLLV